MISEFFFWKEYKNKDCFLNFMGAYTAGKEGYLVFESFSCTLEQALNGRLIKDEIKSSITMSCYRILEALQKGKKMHRDLRPGNIGLNEKKQIKLLDFGMLRCNLGFMVNENLTNIDYVDKYRHKYSPPETLNNTGMMDIKNDVWSFGCILIDIYSKEDPIWKKNITKNEILARKKFPIIPNDITGLLKDIVARCLDPNYETRINIFELEGIMHIFLNASTKTSNEDLEKRIGICRINLVNNKDLKEMNEYCDSLDQRITKVNKAITEEFQENTLLMKKQLITLNEDVNTKINDNYSLIKVQLQEILHKKIEFLNMFYDKILENVMLMQQKYGECMSDNVEGSQHV